MARPKKQTVDYFPHSCTHGKTIYILERKWGNDGYAFWFKLLEALGAADGHFIDCGDINHWEYLVATSGVDDEVCEDILAKLAGMGKIDSNLWNEKRVIWCDSFVDGIKDVYRNRTLEMPTKDSFLRQKPEESVVTDDINPQTKLNYSKVNESKVNKVVFSFDEIWGRYPNKDSRKAAERHFNNSVKKESDWEDINTALDKYLDHLKLETWKKAKSGSTWFNNWTDWIEWEEPVDTLAIEIDQVNTDAADKLYDSLVEFFNGDESMAYAAGQKGYSIAPNGNLNWNGAIIASKEDFESGHYDAAELNPKPPF
ncbi:DUF4373 domain-containing protein [Candidatus Pacearchaeota archaeon]|nr:DUF4373 domain-containing protein [Candidatus Pacearchaeota archaeon]